VARTVDAERREIETVRRMVPLARTDVLDIGCGDGRATLRLAETAATVVGVDPDAAAIAAARARAAQHAVAHATFIEADVTTLAWAAAAFDIVVFSRSL
jgi:ubiquinone/menaquinone biosynthesis C-methylase UbiE